jgi:aminoglycoside phosphotransferase (APT) family kinase protein
VPTAWERDLPAARAGVERWLRGKLPGASDLELSELSAPQASGFSNETLLFDLEWTEAGRRRSESLVLRIQPTGFQVFPEYDMRVQYECMRLLGRQGIPVPKTFWLELDDTGVVGAPFYVMGRVAGRAAPDRPLYTTEGWLKELAPADQARVWWGGIESMAAIHRLDWRALGFGFVDKPELGRTGLDQQLAYYERYLRWTARGKPQPTAEAAWEWLQKNKPVDEPDSLLWGDARIGNILFEPEGTKVAAVLDWEMVTHGNGEEDLAWAIFLDRHHSEGIGVPRLPGFPSYEATIARYEELTGRKTRWHKFYSVFAGFRFAVIMSRIAQQMVHYGVMPADSTFETNNTVTQLLAKDLGLPAPG